MSLGQSTFLGENEIRRLLGFGIRKELRLLSPSFIPEMAEKAPGTDNLAQYGLSYIYNARLSHYDSAGNYLYTENDIDLSQYWTSSTYTLPPNANFLSAYTRRGIHYGYLTAGAQLPDFTGLGYDDSTSLYFGFELGAGGIWGVATWQYAKYTSNRLFVSVGGTGAYSTQMEQTISLPSNYLTAKNYYWVKINKHQIWFGINGKIRAIAILAKSGVSQLLYNNTQPYTIFITPFYIPETQHALIELAAIKGGAYVGASASIGWSDYRFAEGDPIPPLTLPLYIECQDTVLASQSISSGSITSHAIPTFGYKEWELLIDANQDFTVQLQYLGLSGNWRTFDNYSSPTGSHRIHLLVDEPMVLAKAVITPSAYPMTINDALAVMVS